MNNSGKGAGLHNVGEEYMRHLMGNRMFDLSGIAIHGANAENVLTTIATPYTIGGVFSVASIKAEIDISTLVGLPTMALPDLTTQYFGLSIDAVDNLMVTYGDQVDSAAIAAGTKVHDWPVAVDELQALMAVVTVVNASGADFVFGTTPLNTAGLTVTYLNISIPGSQ